MASEFTDGRAASAAPVGAVGRVRWVIVGLLFAATAINYVDRQMIGLLKPTLQTEFRWNETTYADIVFWFQLAYAVGYIVFGNVVDRIGARLGYAAAFVIWTGAHMLHAVARLHEPLVRAMALHAQLAPALAVDHLVDGGVALQYLHAGAFSL